MKSKLFSSAIVAIALLIGCTTSDPTAELVKTRLAEMTGTDAASLKIEEMSEPAPWTAADSAAVLQEELEAKKQEKLDHLYKAIELSKSAIESAEEAKKGGFSALNDMADATIEESYKTIKEAKTMIDKLETGDYSGTDLEDLWTRISTYSANAETVLLQKVSGKWAADGGEPQAFEMLLSQDLTKVIGSSN